MHKKIIGIFLVLVGVGILWYMPIPTCIARSPMIPGVPFTVCIVSNPILAFTAGINPNYILGGLVAIVGLLILMKSGHKARRGEAILGTGLFGILGLAILGIAVLSLILGVAIGATLFSGIAFSMPGGGSIVLQSWQTAILIGAIGAGFLFAGMKLEKGHHKGRG